MKTALLQLSSSDDPADNLATTQDLIRQAAQQGCGFVLTPEVTNCVSMDRAHQTHVLVEEDEDATLSALCALARDLNLWLLIGSLALKLRKPETRFANRSFLIAPNGQIEAWYDKINMFDVTVSEEETYKESAGYRPGDRAVVSKTPFGTVGLTICYDLRFPGLFRTLAQAGADFITVPSAFSTVTGKAHWEPLLRARAIETGCYILAPAQTGQHRAESGTPRRTYGHSLAVSPWGEVLADAGDAPGMIVVDMDRATVLEARQRIPSLSDSRVEFAQ